MHQSRFVYSLKPPAGLVVRDFDFVIIGLYNL